MDFINKEGMFKSSEYKKYRYQLVRSFDDSLLGHLYLIHYDRKHEYLFRVYALQNELSGDLLIRKDDYAIVSVNYKFEKNIKLERKMTKQYNKLSVAAKNGYIHVVPDSSAVTLYSRYKKDPAIGKYFLSYADVTRYTNGTVIKTAQPVHLVQDLTLYAIDAPELFSDVSAIPAATFSHFDYKKNYHPDFWKTFTAPQQSSYNLVH